jgi:streptogramin lyase
MTTGPDGNLWFTNATGNQIARVAIDPPTTTTSTTTTTP